MATDTDPYSYRGRLREGVAFLLVDNRRRVLLEWRPDKDGKHTDVFYPSGSIEMKDHGHDGIDYREVALRREIGEEFRGGVTVERVLYLGETKVPAIGLIFYVYWVEAWSGDPGGWTWEDGAAHARLEWTPIDVVKDVIPWETGALMTQMLQAAMQRDGIPD
jgi:8-oxo-dGTP pyrophosphatase MutT (NUDIX family)